MMWNLQCYPTAVLNESRFEWKRLHFGPRWGDYKGPRLPSYLGRRIPLPFLTPSMPSAPCFNKARRLFFWPCLRDWVKRDFFCSPDATSPDATFLFLTSDQQRQSTECASVDVQIHKWRGDSLVMKADTCPRVRWNFSGAWEQCWPKPKVVVVVVVMVLLLLLLL